MRLVEATVSYLELREKQPPVPPPDIDEPLELRSFDRIDLDLYRALYSAVGEPHHWTSRRLPDKALAADIHADGMSVHVLEAGGEPAGWFELEAGRQPGRTRIVHFGTMPRFRGRGLARYLLSEAIATAFATGADRVTLETNTLDHPVALKLYLEAGFACVSTRVVVTPAIDG